MRFITDGMLGKLTRWLRLAGHDVLYAGDLKMDPETQDDTLITRAKTMRRVLLTSDVALYRRAKKAGAKSFLVRSTGVISQLVEISKLRGQKVRMDFENSRCPVCNGSLRTVGKQEVRGLVPENVFISRERFWVCTECKKTYWEGKHWKTIIEMASKYNELVGEDANA
jgi:hypothetical protein